MRLLHTGDWHIGKRLYGLDRLHETRDALTRVALIGEAARVDAILVAGDILDRKLIEPATLTVALEALEALAAVAPVVAITGNHDDPAFWAQLAPYLAPRILVAATDTVLGVDTESGPLTIGCVPWPELADVDADPGVGRGASRQAYAELVEERLRDIGARIDDARTRHGGPAVMLAHLMVRHGRSGGGERDLTLGGTYAVAGAALPDVDYVGLGHLHQAQLIPGCRTEGRYSGSPLTLDFSGDATQPSVAIVDVGTTTTVTEVPIEGGRQLIRLRGTLDELNRRAREHPDAWFSCQVTMTDARLDVVREVRERVPNALRVEVLNVEPGVVADRAVPTAEADLVEAYSQWLQTVGRPTDPALVDAMRKALESQDGQ